MKNKTIISLLLIFSSWNIHSAHSIQQLFDEMGSSDKDVELSKLNTKFKKQNLKGSKSRLWPTLGLNFTANKSADSSVPVSTSSLGTGISTGSGLGDQTSSSSYLDSEDLTEGWIGQLSLGYFIFTKFAISEDIKRSEYELKSATIKESLLFDQKKAQVLQLIMEWQWLHKMKEPIEQASKVMERIQRFSKKRSNLLYSRRDRIDLEEKSAAVEYNKIKVLEGLSLIESALKTYIPSINSQTLAQLPETQIEYSLPLHQNIDQKYKKQSRDYQIAEFSVKTAKGWNRVAEWNREWIPSVYWTAGYSQSGNYSNETNDNGLSTSLILSFNLFDGFYSSARRQQSKIGIQAAKAKKESETQKKILFLKHSLMQTRVKKAEFKVKLSQARKKELRYKDIKRKVRQGIGSKLDLSAGALDFVKSKSEALETMKKYQQSLLDIAVELNEWNKVVIHEK